MHHHRSHTSRHENKRLDSKAFRAAEKAAMDRSPSVPPSDHWGRGAELPIPDNVPSNGKKRGNKKVRKPKDKCPVNRVHEWYKEEIPNPDWYSHYREKWIAGEGTFDQWICIHCWKVHQPKRRYRGRRRHWRYYRTGTPTLPKRPVKF